MTEMASSRFAWPRPGMHEGWECPVPKINRQAYVQPRFAALWLHGKLGMVQSTRTKPDTATLRHRVMQLSRRWLPTLLCRVGVSQLEADKLRQLHELSELEAELLQALIAVQLRGCARGESRGQVMDAIETIAKLRRALELAESNFDHAQALVDEVDRRWLRQILFGVEDRWRSRFESGPELGAIGRRADVVTT